MKKQLLVFLSLIAGFTFFGTGACASEALSVSTQADGITLSAIQMGNENYLFLPATADLSELTLSFEKNGETVNHDVTVRGENGGVAAADSFELARVASKNKAGCYVVSAHTKDGDGMRIRIMRGEEIPSLYLSSYDPEKGREWVDTSKKNEATGSMKLVAADGHVIYDGALTQIKPRGNSTFAHYPKKAYQIKLDKKTDLLGTGEKGKTWVLLANYGDATLLHDKFMKDLSADLGMDFAITSDWVNLYYDGEYRGVYLLSEKVSVGSTGVDITDMEEEYEAKNMDYGEHMQIVQGVNRCGQEYLYTENLVEPEDMTGGFLIEKNNNFIDEANGFYTAQGVAFNLKSPEWAGPEAMEYISEYYQAFENAVYATDAAGNYTGYNTETGKYYYEYCDLDSLVKVFLLQELALNPDGFYSSLFFYKDKDGIMYAGPVWDQDMTLGTGWSKYISTKVIDYHYLAEALIRIPHFKAEVETYFANYLLPYVESQLVPNGPIDKEIHMLSANAAMNYVLWPYVRVGDPANESHLWAAGTSYTTVTEDMKGWMDRRLNVMKDTFHVPDTLKYFEDVGTADWEYEAVCYVTANGIFNGVTEERFDPDTSASRAMVWTVLARIAGQSTTAAPGEAWYQPGLDWAVTNGVSDGTNPGAPITRQQLATMLYRYMGEPEGMGSLDGIRDAEEISAWAADAMRWAVAEGIFRGDGEGMLNPNGTATRAVLAQVMMNFMEN